MSSPPDTDVDALHSADVGRDAAPPANPATPASSQLPERVGGYIIEGLLGSGVLGRSYRARLDPHSPASTQHRDVEAPAAADGSDVEAHDVVAHDRAESVRDPTSEPPPAVSPGSESEPDQTERRAQLRPDAPMPSVVAVKVLHADLAADASFMRRLTREVDAAAKLEHQNIARILPHGEDPSAGAYLCRELVDGDDLLTAVRRDAVTPRRLCELFSQLLSALSEAHRNGVLHRNLKPSNVLVVRDEHGKEHVKVCDFGNPLRVRPNAEYMAPEQRSGLPIDGRADVYAVGVMLYELLAGEVPFRGATPEETLAMHQHESLLMPREKRPDAALPRELEAVCMKALAKDPRDRHRSPREMSQALRAVVALLGLRSDEPLGSSAFADHSDIVPPSLARMTVPGEQLRSRTKFYLGAGLVVAVCALVVMNPDDDPAPERTDRPSANASKNEVEHGLRLLELGQEHLRSGDVEGAVDDLRDARSSLGDTPEVLRALGEALVIHGNHAEGVALLSRYLDTEPNARDRSFVESLVRSSPKPAEK